MSSISQWQRDREGKEHPPTPAAKAGGAGAGGAAGAAGASFKSAPGDDAIKGVWTFRMYTDVLHAQSVLRPVLDIDRLPLIIHSGSMVAFWGWEGRRGFHTAALQAR